MRQPPVRFVSAAADQNSPDREVVDLAFQDARVVGIFHASGSWGNGEEAADWVRRRCVARWSLRAVLSPADATADLMDAASEIPASVRGEDGCDFNVALLFLESCACHLLAAGAIAARVFTPDSRSDLFQPNSTSRRYSYVEHFASRSAPRRLRQFT